MMEEEAAPEKMENRVGDVPIQDELRRASDAEAKVNAQRATIEGDSAQGVHVKGGIAWDGGARSREKFG